MLRSVCTLRYVCVPLVWMVRFSASYINKGFFFEEREGRISPCKCRVSVEISGTEENE